MNVLSFGEILWDIIDGKKHLGGALLNFSAHKVQCGQSSAIVSCMRMDGLVDRAMIQELNVATSLTQEFNEKKYGKNPRYS